MDRRCFDFLYAEICVALGRRVSRYQLWLVVTECSEDAVTQSPCEKQRFFEDCMDAFRAEREEPLSPRVKRRLGRRFAGYDPRFKTPEEWLGGLRG